ncbi:rho guanine nucleotide exchange factor 39 isoform X2 [Balaenoptera musculus]|uniref:Rho guanine nucleotide exchange factor 39 isoform X2 n=1 Tax=Balaenoptera musculus TaxID=9771 RepID=A0A8B8XRR3_BALMU|nr:rho guanine nucleotide exchange factor 39 isoform X2 [Balaenoptera musculus]
MRFSWQLRTLRPARSLQAPEGALLSKALPPRPRPRSRWNLNLRRAAAAGVDPSVRHGEPGPQRTVPGARAACSLGAETRLHCPGAAGDRAALPGTAGAGGHGAGPAHPPYFVGILRAKGTLRPPERQALFGPWELIYGASQELLPYLEGGRWGQGLEGFCPHLELYTQFAANAERSRTTLQEQLKKNKRFRRFVRLQEGRPEFGGLQLQDLLPLPLQRLQQYENLAIALAENTGPNSPDHEQLTRAARRISETAQRVHTISQKQKNDQHLQRVQALLSGRQAKGLVSGRWFLRQGWLLVVPPRGEPRPRMFFLFSDALLMAKPRPPLHLLQSGTFACQALYPMAECQLHRVFGHSGGPCGGLLSLSFPHEKLLLMSTDQEELSHWHHSLTLASSSQKN